MDVKKIYIDMDGVVADFDDGVKRLLNMEPQNQDNQTDEYQYLMWKGIREYGHFYLDLIPIDGSVEAFKKLYEKYGDSVEILTGCPKEKRGIIHAREDKVQWVNKYLSQNVKVNLVLREEKKKFVTGRDCILIDDYRINIDEWEANGGTGILFSDWKNVIDKLI